MKRYIFSIILFSICFCAYSQVQLNNSIGISEFITEVNNVMPNEFVVGWEILDSARSQIADRKDLIDAIKKSDFQRICKTIEAETDYECLIGNNYLVIIPKENSSQHDVPLARRKIVYAVENNISLRDFLSKIRAVNETEQVKLSLTTQWNNGLTNGNISFQADEGFVFKVMNDIARQLNSRYWFISHFVLIDSKSQKPLLPIKMGFGCIGFFPKLETIKVPNPTSS